MKRKKTKWKEIEEKVIASLKDEQQKWVRKNVNLEKDNDLLFKSRDELLKMFPDIVETPEGPKQALNDRACIQTFIWQCWLRIKVKELEPVSGNIRSFWYRDLEPFYIKNDLLESDIGPPIKEMLLAALSVTELDIARDFKKEPFTLLESLRKEEPILFNRLLYNARETYLQNLLAKCFDSFVLMGIFRFQDEFDFKDPREDFRIIGRKKRQVLLYTEKEGLWWLCEYAAETHGISAVASKGEPGLLSTEYLHDALKQAGARTLKIGAITDYDPWGYAIAFNFANKLREPIFFGPGKVNLTVLNGTQEDLKKFFTAEEIEKGKRDLRKYSQYKQKQVEEWMKITNGINGEPYGIHIDLADRDKLRKEVDRWIKSI